MSKTKRVAGKSDEASGKPDAWELTALLATWRVEAAAKRHSAKSYRNGCPDHTMKASTLNMRAHQLEVCAEELEVAINGTVTFGEAAESTSASQSFEAGSVSSESGMGEERLIGTPIDGTGVTSPKHADQDTGPLDVQSLRQGVD